MTIEIGKKHHPPYVSYRTFHNFIDRLHQQGTPARIDRSYWGDILSGSTGPQLVAALRYLNLVDHNGKPTERLKSLVPAEGEKRTQVIRSITTESYSFVIKSNLDLASATYAQIEETFGNNFSLTGDVRRKCVKFFIAIAGDGGITISPHIIKHTRSMRNGAAAKNGTKKTAVKSSAPVKVPQQTNIPQALNIPQGNNMQITTEQLPDYLSELIVRLLDKYPNFDPAWNDDIKLKWMTTYHEVFWKIIFNK
jgi:hypothetical protein